jgi:predicted DsbA family dithiol-disulfide isomerase
MQVAPGTVVIWSDIGCPWAHIAVWRLHHARSRLGLDEHVRFDHRVFPLELFNSQPTPREELEAELDACASIAPRAGWQPWAAPSWAWPATMLPPMEAVQVAKEQGLGASEQLDRGLRRAFWGESRCISMRHVILEVAAECDGIDLAALADGLDSGRARRTLFDDWEIAKGDEVRGSPHLFAPDGWSAQNPGLRMTWREEGGHWIPTIHRDRPEIYDEILGRAAG